MRKEIRKENVEILIAVWLPQGTLLRCCAPREIGRRGVAGNERGQKKGGNENWMERKRRTSTTMTTNNSKADDQIPEKKRVLTVGVVYV